MRLASKLVIVSIISSLSLFYVSAEEINIQSKGMVCESCVNRITKQLKKNEAVESVAVDLETQMVRVKTKDKTQLSDVQIKESFSKADLPVEKITR